MISKVNSLNFGNSQAVMPEENKQSTFLKLTSSAKNYAKSALKSFDSFEGEKKDKTNAILGGVALAGGALALISGRGKTKEIEKNGEKITKKLFNWPKFTGSLAAILAGGMGLLVNKSAFSKQNATQNAELKMPQEAQIQTAPEAIGADKNIVAPTPEASEIKSVQNLK